MVVICFVCGAMFGGLVGTATMCLVQVGKENKKDPDGDSIHTRSQRLHERAGSGYDRRLQLNDRKAEERGGGGADIDRAVR